MKVPTLLISGPVGVGKTAVASEISERLDAEGVAHALVDLDALGWCYPRPADDPFRSRFMFRNLGHVWETFREAGAERLVLAWVLQDRAELSRYREAVPGAEITVVRLRAAPEVLLKRVAKREYGSGLARHRARALELARQLDAHPVEDLLIDTDGRTVRAIADEILARVAWLPAGRR